MAVQANELRIGNWVAEGGLPVQIESINVGNVACQPIPLTPEILEKCGFVRNGLKFKNYPLYAHLQPSKHISFKFKDRWIENILPGYPEHLHQLQNLYFALTGEELKVNL